MMYGDQLDKMTKSCHLLPVSKLLKGVPLVGPIWRGEIDIAGSFSGKLDEMELLMPRTLYSRSVKVKQSLQPSLCFSMKNRHAVWPKHFDELGAAQKDIDFFMFPEISRCYIQMMHFFFLSDLAKQRNITARTKNICDRSETNYDNLVEYMISNDQAMTSRMSNLELIVFTSLDRNDNQQQIQGKYYLWGIFKGKRFRRCKSSKAKRTSVEKIKISRSIRTLDCRSKPNIRPHSPLLKHQKKSSVKFSDKPLSKIKICLKKMSPIVEPNLLVAKIPSLGECDFIPSLRPGCKRARSKKRRISNTLNKEAEKVQVEGKRNLRKPVIVTDDDDNMSKEDKFTSVTRGDVMKDGLPNNEQSACGVDDRLANQDSPLLDSPKMVTIDNETKAAEQHSWDSDMEIDSDSFGNNVEKNKEVEHPIWDSDMEIDEPRDDAVKDCLELQPQNKTCLTPFLNSEELPDLPLSREPNPTTNVGRDSSSKESPDMNLCNILNGSNQGNVDNVNLRLNEGSKGDGLTVAVPVVASEPKFCSSLIPLLDYKEESDIQEANLGVDDKIDLCLDEKLLGTPSNSVADIHQNIIEDTVPGRTFAMSAGGFPGLDQLSECQASDLPEQDTCRTPLLDFEEQSRPSSSSTATVVLELDEEEGTTIKETEIFDDRTEITTESTMLKIAGGNFHETTSDTIQVQVGRYTIKSDLAPILTKILNKYGDIALGCSMPEVGLEAICKAFQNVEPVSFRGLLSHHIDRLKNLCQLGEALEMDMKWLSKRCEDLEKTVLRIRQYSSLKKEIAQCDKAIRSLEEKVNVSRAYVGNLLQVNNLIEQELTSMKECREKLHYEVNRIKSKAGRFLGKPLVDGLV